MKKAVVYLSNTGSTKLLAETIAKTLGDDVYCGGIADAPADADLIYAGFWTQGFTCPPPMKAYLASLTGKKIFLFGTGGYNSTPEYFAPIIAAAQENINDSNEVVGSFMCQGKVSATKQEAIKKMDMAKYESMKEQLEISQSHPDEADLAALTKALI